ncbi:MAG: glycosyltransferase family 2 protein [Methanobacteriaceae archaeon]|nr:glycosyltransferase family 2 protein [Methanobacteriaceae archaeon]
MKPKVTIIILNWNGWKDTVECLESVYQINYPNYHVIVVDNNSENDSIEKINSYCKGEIKVASDFIKFNNSNKPINIIKISESEMSFKYEKIKNSSNPKLFIIQNDQNYGFAKGNNIGILYSIYKLESDYVLLLNNDTIVDKNFLNILIKFAEINNDFGLFSPLIYEYYDAEKIQYSSDKIKWYTGMIKKRKNDYNSTLVETDTICGASMLIKRSTIEKIGLLPEDYFMLWEDIDYSTKAIINGIKCGYVPKSKIWHKGSVSIGKASNPLRIKYSIRNSIIFWRKYSNHPIQFLSFLIFLIFIKLPILIVIGLKKHNKKKEVIKSVFSGFSKGFYY